MRAALGMAPALARGSYFIHSAAATAARIAQPTMTRAPCGQNLIPFIKPPVLISIGDFFGERYLVRRNYDARRRPAETLLANRNTIDEQSQQSNFSAQFRSWPTRFVYNAADEGRASADCRRRDRQQFESRRGPGIGNRRHSNSDHRSGAIRQCMEYSRRQRICRVDDLALSRLDSLP